MIERILNKLGLFTRKQYVKLAIAFVTNAEYVEVLEDENKKLKSDYENVVAALKVCEDEKRAILAENEDLRRALENRKKQGDLLLKDFEILSGENEELRKEVERLRLKVVRSVKRRRK